MCIRDSTRTAHGRAVTLMQSSEEFESGTDSLPSYTTEIAPCLCFNTVSCHVVCYNGMNICRTIKLSQYFYKIPQNEINKNTNIKISPCLLYTSRCV